MIRAVLLDIAGVLYDGGTPISGAVETVAELQKQPVAVRFVTNTSQKSPQQVKQQLDDLGFEVKPDQLYTAPTAITSYLKAGGMSCYALVHPNLDREFRSFESPVPDAVVVADAGERFDYASLNKAFQHLMEGARLIAIGDNKYFRKDGQLVLDAGPFIHALAYAADKEPVIIGKPSKTFYRVVIDSVPCSPEEAIMIGDDVDADCIGARRAGLQACLVQTGKYQPGDESRCKLPGLHIVPDVTKIIGEFGLG